MIDIKTLRELIAYDACTGKLTWLPRDLMFCKNDHQANAWNAKHAGTEAGVATDTHGYKAITVFNKRYLVHRLIWAIHYGVWPSGQIDHINGDRSDNRIENLRDVSQSQNQKNAKRRSDNKSGVPGVSWHARYAKWQAAISNDGKRKCLGYFKNLDEAVQIRRAAELSLGYHENHGRIA